MYCLLGVLETKFFSKRFSKYKSIELEPNFIIKSWLSKSDDASMQIISNQIAFAIDWIIIAWIIILK